MQRVSDSAPSQYAKEQSLAAALKEDPGTSPNWRLHKNACPYYRERWFPEHDPTRSEEHTSELQSRFDLVCRLLLENKNWREDSVSGGSGTIQMFLIWKQHKP